MIKRIIRPQTLEEAIKVFVDDFFKSNFALDAAVESIMQDMYADHVESPLAEVLQAEVRKQVNARLRQRS